MNGCVLAGARSSLPTSIAEKAVGSGTGACEIAVLGVAPSSGEAEEDEDWIPGDPRRGVVALSVSQSAVASTSCDACANRRATSMTVNSMGYLFRLGCV